MAGGLGPLLLVLVLLSASGCADYGRQGPSATASANIDRTVGFESESRLSEHYQKHGHEFSSASEAEYLRLAQALRDAPTGGDILEGKRNDGVTTKFDRRTGAFIAFNADKTVRTFFKPNDGEQYYWRQLKR